MLRGAVRRTLFSEFDSDALDSSALVRQFFHFEAIEYPAVEQAIADLAAEVVFPDRVIQFVRPDGRAAIPTPTFWTMRVGGGRGGRRNSASNSNAYCGTGFCARTGLVDSCRVEFRGPRTNIGEARSVVSGRLAVRRRTRRRCGLDARGPAAPTRGRDGAGSRSTAMEPVARLPIENPRDEIGRLGASFNGLIEQLDAMPFATAPFPGGCSARTPNAHRAHEQLGRTDAVDAARCGRCRRVTHVDRG